jgi:ectoine hydroxylase-related dioxygenase (phytanoyl-CoA dioxygenase family)
MVATTASGCMRDGTNHTQVVPDRLFKASSPPRLEELTGLVAQSTSASQYPLSDQIASNIPIYELSHYSPADGALADKLLNEWYHILLSGPGVLVLRDFLPNPELIGTVNEVFTSIISQEGSNGGSKGDHFAAVGSNSRIWNAFQKHALASPGSFVSYYSNPWLSLISEAYLGPAYQLTAQVNLVHPGGKPQVCHRDYHLGFQTNEMAARWPKAMHKASSLLTLQGAVAHSDMPLISGPTRFLPFSQLFDSGFLAYRLPEFSAFFEKNCVSLPLKMGDAVFFNPALFHAAGENKSTDMERSANLLQISSAFGRSMETIDTIAIIEQCWGEVVLMHEEDVGHTNRNGNGNGLDLKDLEHGVSQRVLCAVKAIASGYPFPTNLDRRPPAPGGMAPESEQEVLLLALKERWTVNDAINAVRQLRKDGQA